MIAMAMAMASNGLWRLAIVTTGAKPMEVVQCSNAMIAMNLRW